VPHKLVVAGVMECNRHNDVWISSMSVLIISIKDQIKPAVMSLILRALCLQPWQIHSQVCMSLVLGTFVSSF
jgi:hypothetical protein